MMPALKRIAVIAVASASLFAWAGPSTAFSKLGREDGSAAPEDGVIATPLPPLQPPAGTATTGTAPSDTGSAEAPAAQQAPSAQNQDAPPAAGNPTGAGSDAAGAPASGPAPAPGAEAPAVPPPAEKEPGAAGDGSDASGAADDTEGTDPAASQQATPKEPSGPPPDVFYGENELPGPVRDLRAKLIEIAKSGEIEKLRPYLEPGDSGTVLSFGGVEGDPIEYLKTSSGDGEGVETLAILLEVLESGHIRNEPGTENEIYVWPYFSGLSIEKLTKPQKVELFELITAGDYQEMLGFGAYNFYRVGISPDGKLQFFVAGD